MRGPTGCCAHHSRSPSNYWRYVTHYIPTFFLGLKFVNRDLTQYCLYIYIYIFYGGTQQNFPMITTFIP